MSAGCRPPPGSWSWRATSPPGMRPRWPRCARPGRSCSARRTSPRRCSSTTPATPSTGRPATRTTPRAAAGGSSGGEAAAIAAAMSPWGLGSDLASSIRNPAHFTGIFGLLPSVGVIPGPGSWPPDATPGLALMCRVGPMARSAADLELMLRKVAAPGTAAAEPTTPPASAAGLAVAAFAEDGMQPTAAACREAVHRAAAALADAGHAVDDAQLPNLVEVRQCFDAVVGIEAMVVWPPYVDPEREHEDHLAELIRMPPPPTPPSAEDRVADQRSTGRARARVRGVAGTPADRHLPRRADERPARRRRGSPRWTGSRSARVARCRWGRTRTRSVLPAAAVPVLTDEAGLPIGIQVIGRRGRDLEVLAVAQELEPALGGWIRPPL